MKDVETDAEAPGGKRAESVFSGSKASIDSRNEDSLDNERDARSSQKGKGSISNQSRGDEKLRSIIAQKRGSKKSSGKITKTTASKLEDQMNFEHLKALEDIFEESDADHGGGLDIDEFREAMKRTMGSEIDDKELETIFMKVDTNCDGTVDWDEYLSYMLLEYQEKDTMTSLTREVPFPKRLKERQSYHRDFVVRIVFLQHLTNRLGNKALDRDNPGGRFISLSKEGQMGIYGTDFELQRSLTIDPGKDSFTGQWLTDMVALANVGMIAISSPEREISFYDMNANKFEKQFQITGFKDAILSMDFWFDHGNLNHCTLVAGDASGNIFVVRFVEALNKGLFGLAPPKGVKKIAFVSLVKHRINAAFGMVFENVHTNWVNCVRYYVLAQGSECFISCSSSDNDSMYLGDLTNISYKAKWPGFSKSFSSKTSYFKVRKGILALDYSKDWNVIVTGSPDGVVRTWNPYSSKPGGTIKGHMTPVQHVIIVSSSGQVITAGRDRTLRIIELRDHKTTQIIGPRSFLRCAPSSQPLQAMYYHGRTKALWVATIQVGLLEGFDDRAKEDQMTIKTHDGPVMSVLYNHLFNQVVTGGHDSIVSVWDLNTGVKAIQFYTVKGVELTAMTFDPTGRRLITGSRNGVIKIWNFNNGACLRTLEEETLLEVTGIVCMKQKIIAAGWNKVPIVYIDTKGDEDNELHQWAKIHKDDILCMAQFQNNSGTAIIASASYDGDIIIWSVDSGQALCRLNRFEAYVPRSIKEYKMTHVKRNTTVDLSRNSLSAHSSGSEILLSDFSSTKSRRNALTETSIKFPPIKSRNRKYVDAEDAAGDSSSIRHTEASPEPRPMAPTKNSITKSIKFNLPEAVSPSAGIDGKTKSKWEKIKHQIDVATGQEEKDYWEADVSIDKLLFLQSRPHEQQTATLFASGAMGWVYAWSVHPQGGLLGQFVGAHRDGDAVFSMASDKENKFLVTGDTSGYVKIWKIENYCCKKRKQSRIKKLSAPYFDIEEEKLRVLSVRRKMKISLIPPELSFYFHAHIGSVTDITLIDEKQLLLTACGDGTVRLWTMTGKYIGTFGQKQPWQSNVTIDGRMPIDIKRIASVNTLKLFQSDRSPWKLARNILNFVSINSNRRHHDRSVESNLDMEKLKTIYGQFLADDRAKTDEEIEKNYQTCVEKLKISKVLGKSYKPKQRHRILPKIDVKTHLSNFHVHSALPFSPLEETVVVAVPDILQEKWRIQKEMASEYEKDRFGRTPIKNSRLIYPSMKRSDRSQATFAGTGNRIVKALRVFKPTR